MFLMEHIVGDMQLTKAEIAQTQVIVTTPEKWDVVTRKPTGEGELASVRYILRKFNKLTRFTESQTAYYR
jgi:hypothetical protein